MTEHAAELARQWIGTPYLHRASLRGVGADCLGLIRGVWRELYGQEPEQLPVYTPDWGEYGGSELLRDGTARHLRAVPNSAAWAVGQVLLFRMRRAAPAKHLGILSAPDRFIHAYSRHGVVENPLGLPWQQRVAARFAFP